MDNDTAVMLCPHVGRFVLTVCVVLISLMTILVNTG